MSTALGTAEVLHGNALDLPFPDDSIDLVVTSPPYFQLRSYSDDGQHYDGQIGDEPTPEAFIDALLAVTREAMRVLTPAGSLWVNLGDKYNAYNGNRGEGTLQRNHIRQSLPKGHGLDVKGIPSKSLVGIPWRYALRCIDDLDVVLRDEVIWRKNGLPESVTDRVRRNHEHWFHFTAPGPYYQAPTATSENGSVWHINTEPLRLPPHLGVTHFAAFPKALPARIIDGWCPSGGTVLDPFGGTGTTALVAKALGRHGISLDLSHDYGRIAEWRTNDPAQLAKIRTAQTPSP